MARYYGIQERAGRLTGSLTLVCPLADKNDTDEHDTGYALQAYDIIKDVYVRVYTAEATASTKTIDVGLLSSQSGGDADGLLDGVSTSAAGTIKGESAITTGSNTKFAAATPTRGVLMMDHQAGTDVDQDEGVAYKKHHVCNTTALNISYTLGEAATELDADIVVEFFRPNSN
jgi:hypothetical protein